MSGPMTEPREALTARAKEIERTTRHNFSSEGRLAHEAALIAVNLAAGVHLGDEGLRGRSEWIVVYQVHESQRDEADWTTLTGYPTEEAARADLQRIMESRYTLAARLYRRDYVLCAALAAQENPK